MTTEVMIINKGPRPIRIDNPTGSSVRIEPGEYLEGLYIWDGGDIKIKEDGPCDD